jgi:hypothetical protein
MNQTPPTKTNADRNREYRARHNDRINEAKRNKRQSLKAIVKVEGEIETPILKKVAKLPTTSTTEPAILQEITKQNYTSFIRAFYKRYTDKDLTDNNDIFKKISGTPYKAMAISKDFKPFITSNIKEIIKNPQEVKKLYIILRGIRGFADIEKILYPYLKEYQEQYQANRSIIKAEPEDLDIISFDIDDIRGNLDKIDNKQDKIIYGFAMIIKRRLADLQYMKVATNKADIGNKANNWIYNNKIYINRTKNKDNMILDIPDDFNELVKDISGGYVLGRDIPQATLSEQIQRIFKRVYGKIYTANNIRHLYATHIINKGASYAEKRDTARASGHTIGEQAKYSYVVV